MYKSIKEYFEYRKNMRVVKSELTKIMATTLPIIRETSEKTTDIMTFISCLAKEVKTVKGEKLVEMVLKEISDKLATDQTRLVEIFTYMANLQPADIQKILVHSVVETMPNNEKKQ